MFPNFLPHLFAHLTSYSSLPALPQQRHVFRRFHITTKTRPNDYKFGSTACLEQCKYVEKQLLWIFVYWKILFHTWCCRLLRLHCNLIALITTMNKWCFGRLCNTVLLFFLFHTGICSFRGKMISKQAIHETLLTKIHQLVHVWYEVRWSQLTMFNHIIAHYSIIGWFFKTTHILHNRTCWYTQYENSQ